MQIAFVILLALLILGTFSLYFSFFPPKERLGVRFVARVGIFGAFASILYVIPIFTIKLPFFPSFLTLHFDEIPCLLAGIAYGPLAGVMTALVKTIIKLPLTKTMYVGELCDFVLSTIYVLVVSLIYKKKKTNKGLAISISIATAFQLVSAMLLNVYLLVPFYTKLYFNGDGAALLALMQKAMPAIKDIGWSYATIAVLPFNLLKDAIVIAIVIVVYRILSRFIKNISR